MHCTIQGHGSSAARGQECVFPFTFNGKVFNDCAEKSKFDGKGWCSTTPDFAGVWGICGLCPAETGGVQLQVREEVNAADGSAHHMCLSMRIGEESLG